MDTDVALMSPEELREEIARLRGMLAFSLVPDGRLELEALSARSSKWAIVAAGHLSMFPVCASCGGDAYLQVHHKRPYHIFPELELNPDNLITLCMAPSRFCHFIDGHCGDWRAYNPHVVEDAKYRLRRRKERLYE